MKILILTKKFPYPLKDGESIAVSNLAMSLSSLGVDVDLLSMNTIKHHVDVKDLPSEYNCFKNIYTVPLDNRVKALGAFLNLFSSESYHVSRFFFEDYREKLIGLLRTKSYDIVQLETLYLAPYIDTIKIHSEAQIVMRSHNVEFEIWERISTNTNNLFKRKYLEYLTKKLKRFEITQLLKYDHLITVTQRDFERYKDLGYRKGGFALPIGIAIKDYRATELLQSSFSASFIGSLDWLPNLEGLEWFIEKVMPTVVKQVPHFKLHIAGRNTPEELKNLGSDNVIVEGEVEDAKAFLNSHAVTIVPLLSGSGMRVKILEGMALGRIVLSTDIGAEGIPATNGINIFMENDPESFATILIRLISLDIDAQKVISKAARNFIADQFDRETNAEKLLDYYRKISI